MKRTALYLFCGLLLPSHPQAANIAWISHHPGDAEPSSAAAGAGFIQAPDSGYTELLRANGHNVTRYVTSPEPDLAILNTFDLVIVGRSTLSGHYQTDDSRALWHGISTPMMFMSSFILRDNRLGFTTGNLIEDTGGAIGLTVNDPAHPIFAGIPLDDNQIMVNPFADVVSFDGVVQRGISVNNDPVVGGGIVLATGGTTGDPTFGGMFIGEWEAGAVLGHGEMLAGPRLVFLSGSRENVGLTLEGAGIYDLHPDGAQIFLNAVTYLASYDPSIHPAVPVFFVRHPKSQIVIEGDSITFSSIVAGTPPIHLQWRKNGVDIPGANEASYTTPPLTLNDDGALYSVMAINNDGANQALSAEATVLVGRPQFNLETGNWYLAVPVPNGINWDDARSLAEEMGGYLAVVTTRQEQEFIVGAFPDAVQDWNGYWLGGFQPGDDPEADGDPAAGWQWVNGEPLDPLLWALFGSPFDEPNDCECVGGKEDALHLWAHGAGWNDLPREHVNGGFVVEFDGVRDRDGDGIPDDVDTCPDSDVRPTVVIGELDSRVGNIHVSDGCTLADFIRSAAEATRNRGQFVSAVTAMVNELRGAGLLTVRESSAIVNTAARATTRY